MKNEDNKIDLNKFCAAEFDPRPYLRAPFRENGSIIATNGHILISIPDNGGDYPSTHERMIGKVTQLRASSPTRVNWTTINSIVLPDAQICSACAGRGYLIGSTCEDCEGEGSFKHGQHWYRCKPCDEHGFIEHEGGSEKHECGSCQGGHTFQAVKVGTTHFQRKYLALLAELPDCELIPNGLAAAPFRFQGGYGFLMPCRSPEDQHDAR